MLAAGKGDKDLSMSAIAAARRLVDELVQAGKLEVRRAETVGRDLLALLATTHPLPHIPWHRRVRSARRMIDPLADEL